MRTRHRGGAALSLRTRLAVGVLGAAIFGTGVGAVFATTNGTGAAALLAIGAGLLLLAVLGDRLSSLEFGGVSITLKDVARQTLALAVDAERAGDVEKARRLRAAAKQLQRLASDYRGVRNRVPAGPERTRVFDALMARTRNLAVEGDLEPDDVVRWFDEGVPEARVTALGLMEGNPRLRDFDAALDAIEQSRSAYEQYHGLLLAEMMLPELNAVQRAQLKVVVQRARKSWYVRRSTSRKATADRIVAGLNTTQ